MDTTNYITALEHRLTSAYQRKCEEVANLRVKISRMKMSIDRYQKNIDRVYFLKDYEFGFKANLYHDPLYTKLIDVLIELERNKESANIDMKTYTEFQLGYDDVGRLVHQIINRSMNQLTYERLSALDPSKICAEAVNKMRELD